LGDDLRGSTVPSTRGHPGGPRFKAKGRGPRTGTDGTGSVLGGLTGGHRRSARPAPYSVSTSIRAVPSHRPSVAPVFPVRVPLAYAVSNRQCSPPSGPSVAPTMSLGFRRPTLCPATDGELVLHQDRALYLTLAVGLATGRVTWTPRIEIETTSVRVPLVTQMDPRLRTVGRERTTVGCARWWKIPQRSSR